MWILNAHIPTSLMLESFSGATGFADSAEDCLKVHLQVSSQGVYSQILLAREFPPLKQMATEAVIDQRGGLLLPCFVDIHTHLDKGHSVSRTPNPDGSFAGAMAAVPQDAQQYWTEEDLYRRMSFGLQCSYAHGTQGIRTHLDSSGPLGVRVWKVFRALQQEWSDRLTLQGVALVPPSYYAEPEAETLLALVAEAHGLLGGFFFADPAVPLWLEGLFALAHRGGFALDLHVDESNNPRDRSLRAIAEHKLRQDFPYPVVCGHCCSLSLQPEQDLAETIALVKAADIGIVSLPLCNLYLQDRRPQRTPHWRGVTALHELRQAGVPLALASDNCRDPFYAFGDHDGLEVLRESTRIAHLDHPFGDWVTAVTRTPGAWLGLASETTLQVGAPANFILFQGRTWNEVLSRPESDRRVFRHGQEIYAKPPSYETL
ncbi:MAG: cytosine deaminase [Prochlorotrichaceae cyanobacterium]